MRNRFVAGKLKRRWTVWGVGYFKPPGETLSRKPRAVASQRWVSGWAAVPRASSWQSQGQGLGGTRGDGHNTTTPAYTGAKTERAPAVSAAVLPPAPRDPAPGVHAHQACWGAAAVTAVLDGTAAERRVSPFFFSPFSLRACCLTKPLVTLDFFQFLLHKMQHSNNIKRGYGEQWVQQINGQAQPSSAFIAISPEEHSLPWSLWNEPQQSLDLAGSWQTRTFLSQLNPEDSSSGRAHVNLIIVIKVLLAQQCKLRAQCINLVKITERSQVMERAEESFSSLFPWRLGGGRSAQISQQCWVMTKGISNLSPDPSKTTHNFLKTPWKHGPPTQLIDWNSFPYKTTWFCSTMAYSKRGRGKKNITMSRKVGKVTLSRQGLLFSP